MNNGDIWTRQPKARCLSCGANLYLWSTTFKVRNLLGVVRICRVCAQGQPDAEPASWDENLIDFVQYQQWSKKGRP